AIPYITLTPLATAVLFKVFLTIERHIHSLILLQTFLAQCPENIIVFDDRNLVYATSCEIHKNKCMQEFLKDPQLLMNSGHDVSAHQNSAALQESLISTAQDAHILCSTIPVILPNNETFNIAFLRDVSKEVIREREIERIARLDLVSQLAAGIGHEIRNPMTTVRGFLEMLGDDKKLGEYKEYFDLMKGELDRANLILSDFLSLTQNKSATYQMTNMNQLINSISPLIYSTALLHNNEIKCDLGAVTDTLVDEKQIRQLILNMVHNALEAMPNGGCLTIKTFSEKGSNVLAFIDQGMGISTAVADKIGTPYFTTKENGTGLGLATCYQIAARNNALIDFDTSPHGTTFYVRFKCTKTDKIKKLA
ncbi:MAG: ATP-binding protein, partial [Ignavibacteriales bacterium]